MNSLNKRIWTAGFIREVVGGWMLGDLDRMTSELKVAPNSRGNCNFPIALYIFACMEFLGYLVSPSEIKDGEKNYTEKRIWSYIELTFGNNIKKFQPYKNIFVKIFRHGLSHEFFAKAAGISRKTGVLFSHQGEFLVLDADEFFRVFEQSAFKLESLVADDLVLCERINSRYNSLVKRNSQKYSLRNLK